MTSILFYQAFFSLLDILNYFSIYFYSFSGFDMTYIGILESNNSSWIFIRESESLKTSLLPVKNEANLNGGNGGFLE